MDNSLLLPYGKKKIYKIQYQMVTLLRVVFNYPVEFSGGLYFSYRFL